MTLSKDEQDQIAAVTDKLAAECWPDIHRVRQATTELALAAKDRDLLKLFLGLVLPDEKAATITMPNPSVFYYNPAWTQAQTYEEIKHAVERAAVLYVARMLSQYEARYETMRVPEIVAELMTKAIPPIEVVRKNRETT